MVNLLRRNGHPADPPRPAVTREAVMGGCHGGAGVTTLARLLGLTWDMGVMVPNPQGRPLVLVTRGTVVGARRATEAVDTALRYDCQPAVLTVVGDGPWPEPKDAATRLRMLSPQVGRLVRVPYVSAWRYMDDPLTAEVPAGVRRAIGHIRDGLGPIHTP